MRRLFNEDCTYTTEASQIDHELISAIHAIMLKHPEVDGRDLESVVNKAAEMACLEMVLGRKSLKG